MPIPSDLRLARGAPEHAAAVRAMLRAAGLPPDGLEVHLPSFVLAFRGAALVAHVLEGLARDGVREVWLLTTTAAGFFARLGFRLARREDAPPAMHASTQFAGACPASATCMALALDAPDAGGRDRDG